MELNEEIERINLLKNEIDALRPIDASTEQRIMQKFRLDWNFHSNNLEGNSLTFGETKSFLLHGITAEGKPLKDHLDLKGHNEAILLLDDIIKNNRPLTETFIRELHEIILHEPYQNPAITPDGAPTTKTVQIGQYKKTPNHVKTATGEIFYFASPEETPAKMNDLMDWYAKVSENGTTHPLIIAAEFHYQFLRIHPFDDGNGRMARILMNLILMKNGYPPVIIKTQEKQDYFRALQMADGGDIANFDTYIGEQLIRSLELFFKGAKGENIEEDDDVDKQIALLKTELQAATHKIIYSDETSELIYNESLLPLLNKIFSKLNQFADLFNHNYYSVKLNAVGTPPYQQINVPYENLLSVLKTRITKTDLDTIEISREFKEFIKTEDKFFDCKVSVQIKLNSFDFIVTLPFADKLSYKIFYHSKEDEKKFNKIANFVSKKILNDIKEKLSE